MKRTAYQIRLKGSFLAVSGAALLLAGTAVAQPEEPAFDIPAAAVASAPGTPDGYVPKQTAKDPSVQLEALRTIEVPGGISLEDAYAELEMRTLSVDLDPITAEDVRKMDGEGLIDRRKKVGEDILIFDVEIERTKRITELVDAMGHDAFKIAYPDLYKLVENSPIILNAKIKQQELKNDLEVALRGPEKPKEEATPEAEASAAAPLTAREDGSSYFALPVAGVPDGQQMPFEGTAAEVPAPAEAEDELADEADEGEEETAEAPADALSDEPLVLTDVQDVVGLEIREPISLREVYGMGDDRRAWILHGKDRILIQAGDELPGATTVKEIGDTHIVILRDEEEIRIQLNG